MKAANVIYQFGEILRSVELPEKWREIIAARCTQEIEESEDTERITRRRAELEAEPSGSSLKVASDYGVRYTLLVGGRLFALLAIFHLHPGQGTFQ